MPPLPPRPGPRCCRCSPPPRPPTGFRGFFMPQPSLRACSGRAAPSTAGRLRSAMEAAFGASDAAGAWAWKDAYEAAEAAQVLFLRKFGRAMRTRAGSRHRDARDAEPDRRASAVADPPLGGKQPLPAILDADRLGSRRRRSRFNHRGRSRSRTLGRDGPVGDLRRTGRRRSRAERDRRHPRRVARPSLPRLRRHTAQRRAHPRSARSGGAAERRADEPALLIVAACREALRRGCLPASRLGFRAAARGRAPRRDHRPQCRSRGAGLARGVRAAAGTGGRVVFSAAIAGQAYARHGTTMDTRLTVIDRVPAEDPHRFPPSPGKAATAAELLDQVIRLVPPRPAARTAPPRPRVSITTDCAAVAARAADSAPTPLLPRVAPAPSAVELAYETCDVGAGRARTPDRRALRGLCAADAAHRRRAAASDQARAIGRDGRRRAAAPVLQAAAAAAPGRGRPPVGRAARKRRLCRGSACRPSRRVLHGRRDLGPGRRRSRGGGRRGALPARLVSRRRHRRRQGPPGRRDHPRQLAQGPPPRAVDLEIRQADRGCRARLDRDRRLPLRPRAAVALQAGRRDHSRRRHPVHDLRDIAHAGERASARAASSRSSTGSASRSFDGVVVFDEAHAMANAAGDKGNAARRNRRSRARRVCACSTHCPMRASSMSRRPARRRCRTSPTPPGSASGAPAIFRSRPAPSSSPRWKGAASPRWRCWRAI